MRELNGSVVKRFKELRSWTACASRVCAPYIRIGLNLIWFGSSATSFISWNKKRATTREEESWDALIIFAEAKGNCFWNFVFFSGERKTEREYNKWSERKIHKRETIFRGNRAVAFGRIQRIFRFRAEMFVNTVGSHTRKQGNDPTSRRDHLAGY